MDKNKYRKKTEGYRQAYLRSALTDSQVQEFILTWNRPGERHCLKCNKLFKSEGMHNRKCVSCKTKEKIQVEQTVTREPLEYRVMHLHKQYHSFRSEIE